MTRIFISYSRQDKTIADYIAAELRVREAEVFIDYQKLVGGENFIRRLGREIESCDYLVMLVSPRSVASKWVQREVAWALKNDKPIIPILLEPASMTDFFFLSTVEQIDFTGWEVEGQVSEAVGKLAGTMGLSLQPTRVEPEPELSSETAPPADEIEDKDELEATQAPAFTGADLRELFFTAVEVADKDPEQTLFLYQRILEINPGYMQGQTQEFVQQEEARLKPIRLNRMKIQAEQMIEVGKWNQVKRIGNDMLALVPEDEQIKALVIGWLKTQAEQMITAGKWSQAERVGDDMLGLAPEDEQIKRLIIGWLTTQAEAMVETGEWDQGERLGYKILELDYINLKARNIVDLCAKNAVCKPMYEHAVAAAGEGRWDVVKALMRHIWETCPDYGDPGDVLRSRPIRAQSIDFLQELSTLTDRSVDSVTFSPDGKLLASISSEGTIKLWQMSEGRELTTLYGHGKGVDSVAFSPDGSLLASVSGENEIRLWGLDWDKEK